MKKVAVFYCKRIQDHTCIACAKCFKGAREKAGEFGHHEDDVEIVALTDCGDCPGLLMPRVTMIMGMLDDMGQTPDAIHLGTCVKMAMEHSECPLDPDELQLKIENKFGMPMYLGTHPYV
jgi:predicted metal-binding protein